MPVDLWYPADYLDSFRAPLATYRTLIWGRGEFAGLSAAEAFQTTSAVAKQDVRILREGRAFPLVVYSHGSVSEPTDVADIAEDLASHGYVFAAPWHIGDTRDDVKIDALNKAAATTVIACLDGRPSPCREASVPASMADRVLDTKYVIDHVGDALGRAVDTSNVAVIGWSRGGVTALALAGGSATFGIPQLTDTRVKGIMAFSGGKAPVMTPIDVQNIKIPTIMVSSPGDIQVPIDLITSTYNLVGSPNKALFQTDNAVHYAIAGSNICPQIQSAGAIYQANPLAFLEKNELTFLLPAQPPGTPFDFCDYANFVSPVDITAVAQSIGGILPTAETIPMKTSYHDVDRVVEELLLPYLVNLFHSRDGTFEPSERSFLNPDYALANEDILISAQATYPLRHGGHDSWRD